jgi:hypothetical protein
MWISESSTGFATAVTRQQAGDADDAEDSAAETMVVLVMERAANASQEDVAPKSPAERQHNKIPERSMKLKGYTRSDRTANRGQVRDLPHEFELRR